MSAGASGGYVLSSRDLLANDIEAVVEGAQLDGMVCLASCDKTTPGQLMAAARLDVPTLVLSCGYQSCGRSTRVSGWTSRRCSCARAGSSSAGSPSTSLCDMSARAITGPGVCTGHGHRELHARRRRGARHDAAGLGAGTGEQRADVAGRRGERRGDRRGGPRGPPAALDPDAGRVRERGDGGSRGQRLDQLRQTPAGDRPRGGHRGRRIRLFEKYADTIRPLSAVRPNGEDTIEEFEDAGGALAVLKQLGDALDR